MKFSEEKTHEVTLHHPDLGDLGEGKMRFGGEHGVSGTFNPSNARPAIDPKVPLDFVTATTKDQQNTFTLFKCRFHFSSFIADCLVFGTVAKDQFRRIDIRLSDISEWFLEEERVQGSVGGALTWTRHSRHFSSDVIEGEKQFRILSRYYGTRERQGENLILSEYVEFSFEATKDHFSVEEAKENAIGLCALMSILIAYPVSIVSIEVYVGDGYARPMYFSTFKQVPRDEPNHFALKCFLRKSTLDGRWPEVLENYFRDAKRRDLWLRLAGMQRYDGFWDFRLVGYVGLLDRYVALLTQNQAFRSEAPSKRKLQKLTAGLCKITPKLDSKVINQVIAVAKTVFGDRSPSFTDRYARAMAATDNSVRDVIHITDEDFELIKDVRDKIAHGQPPDVPEADFTRVHRIIAKIALLLTYWALHDLGIPKNEFLGAMHRTHNRLLLEASVNQKSLARATGAARFINVDPEMFEQLAVRKDLKVYACFLEGPGEELEPSDLHMARWKAWERRANRQTGMFKHEDILEVPKDALSYQGTVYIESGTRDLELSAVFFIDRSKMAQPEVAQTAGQA